MSVRTSGQFALDLEARSERLFRRALAAIGLPALVLCIVVPLWQVRGLERGGGAGGTAAFVEFVETEAPVAEQAEEPAPAEEAAEPESEPEPEPAPEPQPRQPEPARAEASQPEQPPVSAEQAARERARRAGVLALSDALADLRSPSLAGMDLPEPVAGGTADQPGESGGRSAASGPGRRTAEQIAAAAAATSGGVSGTGQVRRRESGTGLAERRTTRLERPAGAGKPTAPRTGQGGDAPVGGRSIDEIQLVMDRNKGAFYAIYTRALREKAWLQGKVSVRMVIEPSGQVSECTVVDSTTGDPEFDERICRRILQINFGAKNVPRQVIPSYPLYFQELG